MLLTNKDEISIREKITIINMTFKGMPNVTNTWIAILNGESGNDSSSLSAFEVLLSQLIEEGYSIEDIMNSTDLQLKISDGVIPFIRNEFESLDYVVQREKVAELRQREYLESGNTFDYYHIRDSISKGNTYINKEEDVLEFKVKSKNSETEIVGRIDNWRTLEKKYGEILLDDLTADALDIITIFLLKFQVSRKSDFLTFHCDDALNMRAIEGRSEKEGYHSRFNTKTRVDIMKRLEVLANISFVTQKRNVKEISSDGTAGKTTEFLRKQPLFAVRDQTMMKEEGKHLGIYEFEISPSDFLFESLTGEKKIITAQYASKILNFDPKKQKYHKRLARYLHWRWGQEYENKQSVSRITTSVGNLLKQLDYNEHQGNPKRIKDEFEKILDELMGVSTKKLGFDTKVIKDWEYEEESQLEGSPRDWPRNWMNDYWVKQKVWIEPPNQLFESSILNDSSRDHQLLERTLKLSKNRNTKIDVDSTDSYEQGHSNKQEALENVGDIILDIRARLGIKQIDAAKEMGIPRTTLVRIETGESKNPRANTMRKIESWITKYS